MFGKYELEHRPLKTMLQFYFHSLCLFKMHNQIHEDMFHNLTEEPDCKCKIIADKIYTIHTNLKLFIQATMTESSMRDEELNKLTKYTCLNFEPILISTTSEDSRTTTGSNSCERTISDISYSTTLNIQSYSTEEVELQSLLSEWKLDIIADELLGKYFEFQYQNDGFKLNSFSAQSVYVNILKIIKRHHIERLLKKFDMGTSILFEHNLELWRESIGSPLRDSINETSCVHNFCSQPGSPASSGSLSRANTPPRTPYERPSTPNVKVDLGTILNESSRGTALVGYYSKFQKFQEEQRSSLIALIAFHFEEKGKK